MSHVVACTTDATARFLRSAAASGGPSEAGALGGECVWYRRHLAFLPLLPAFQNSEDFQFSQHLAWIPSIGANFHIAMDGISFLMVGMTVVVGFLAILCSWNAITVRVKEYYANFLFLQFAMLGVFLARDLLLFFVFWELVLIPMYFIIAIWGGERRSYASMKFLIYTSVGSVLMLLSVLALYFHHFQTAGFYSFDMNDMLATPMGGSWGWQRFLGPLSGLRRQGADVPLSHLAARCTHRSPHRRQRDSG
ncbi:MAG: proton-conducting transporter membrane subunit [Bryobacterales bacterium]|nr:proton-conducting transporter membrane subunit [Bryobacterales bacterium]